MSNQHDEMFYSAYPSNRSPGSNRAQQQQGLRHQASRQFEGYGQNPGLYTAEDHAQRYDSGRFERANAATMHSNFQYELGGSQTWNPNAFGGHNGMATMGGTGRMKPPNRRAGLPTVRICR